MYIGLGAKLISPTLLILSKNGGKLRCDRQNCFLYISLSSKIVCILYIYIGLGAKLISPTLLILSKNGGKLRCDRQNCFLYISLSSKIVCILYIYIYVYRPGAEVNIANLIDII